MPTRAPVAPAIVATAALAFPASAPAQQTHPFDAHDLWAMERISDPQVSPDGEWVVFGLSTLDEDADRRRSDLWIVGTDGSGLKRLTTHSAGEFNPRWAPDGSAVYFLSTRSGSSQVWRIPVRGGEARAVTDLPLDAGSMAVSPDGSRLAVSMEVFPECPDLACTVDRLAEDEARASSGVLYDRLFIRHWDTWEDGRRSHVFTLPVDGGADPVDMMREMDAECPSVPFGGPEEYTFSPDGTAVVFTARVAPETEPWSTDFDLYMAHANGEGSPTLLTEENRAWDTQPVFSPDGTTLAYLAMERPGFESDRFRILVRQGPRGADRVLTGDWDRSVSSMTFSPDGRTLLVTAQNLGNHSLFAVDVASGDVTELLHEGTVRSPAWGGAGIVFGMDHLRSPVELYTARSDGSDIRPITAMNRDRLAAVELGEPEQMTFRGADGDDVYAWLVKPVDFDPARRYPVAFIIHGGPQGSSSNNFHYRWNPQIYAAAGYATLMVDFHGSTGYGQAFTDAITGDWGGKPLEDLRLGLAAALERNPWMDGSRACALGASYGGFMINWIAGNWPDGFDCLVNHDGVFDQRSMYFGTEELWFPEWEMGGTYWESPDGFEEYNPALHVDRWQTPMLVIHGGMDFRVPLEQGIGAFTALQRKGIPSRFLYFPDENHWVLSPANGILWHETVLAWLAEWTRE
ncbi:MAG: S9 family peptidase [Gemmatimonadota bacterium]|jgi:dipeptidyl aminopeptidase/acylaminoacyl peptidase